MLSVRPIQRSAARTKTKTFKTLFLITWGRERFRWHDAQVPPRETAHGFTCHGFLFLQKAVLLPVDRTTFAKPKVVARNAGSRSLPRITGCCSRKRLSVIDGNQLDQGHGIGAATLTTPAVTEANPPRVPSRHRIYHLSDSIYFYAEHV